MPGNFFPNHFFGANFQKISKTKKPHLLKGAVLLIKNGDPDRIRTCGLLIRSQTLYPAELRSQFINI